ncbi:MAG: iron transporter [Lachnospiraceae bacterium]|nr:iron transporter [Lachnospiraceae bacterium]
MKKKMVAMMTAATIVAMAVSGCGGSSSSSSTDTQETATEETAAADDTAEEAETADDAETVEAEVTEDAGAGDAGFTEYPIFEDQEVGFMNLSAVYFQAVPMESETQTIAAEDFDIHLEADISALENDLGFGVGDWVPYLTVDYAIEDTDGNAVTDGTFMTMSASDGPHYGSNIKLDPGTYNVTITIHSPGENGYLIHSDSETGPGGSLADTFADGPMSYTFEGWEYAGLE